MQAVCQSLKSLILMHINPHPSNLQADVTGLLALKSTGHSLYLKQIFVQDYKQVALRAEN